MYQMADIFISSAHEDRETAETLAQAFAEQGCSVWWDDRLRAGENWDQQIKDAINDARVCVVILSAASSPSRPWISKEWSAMLESSWRRQDLRLCPVRIEDVDIPPFLRKWQSLKLSDTKSDVEDVVDRIISLASQAPDHSADVESERDQVATAERFAELGRILTDLKPLLESRSDEDFEVQQ